jgi:hypothetical protein
MTSIQEADDLETDIDLEEKRPTCCSVQPAGRAESQKWFNRPPRVE